MRRYLVWTLVVGSTVMLNCGGMAEPAEGPPAVPPASSIVIEFDDFQSPLSSSAFVVGQHWTGSAATIAVWNTIITVTLATPVAAFLGAANGTPEWKNDRWQWVYDFSVGSVAHSAVLLAAPATGGHNWSMYVSQDGGYDDFNWYNGFTELDGSGGSWTLDVGPDDRTPFMRIEWTYNAINATGDIRYTNIIQNSTESGSYITYGRTNGVVYDSFYRIFSASANNVTEIEWHTTTKEGRVRDPDRFGDEEWHCWNGSLDDITCTS